MSWRAKASAHMKNVAPHHADDAGFDLAMLSLVSVATLGLSDKLAIATWITIACAAVLRLRLQVAPIPRAQLVDHASLAAQRTH